MTAGVTAAVHLPPALLAPVEAPEEPTAAAPFAVDRGTALGVATEADAVGEGDAEAGGFDESDGVAAKQFAAAVRAATDGLVVPGSDVIDLDAETDPEDDTETDTDDEPAQVAEVGSGADANGQSANGASAEGRNGLEGGDGVDESDDVEAEAAELATHVSNDPHPSGPNGVVAAGDEMDDEMDDVDVYSVVSDFTGGVERPALVTPTARRRSGPGAPDDDTPDDD